MTTQTQTIVQGNYGMDLPFTLTDGNNNPIDLSGVGKETPTLELLVQDAQDNTGVLISLGGSMTIDEPTAGTCHYTVAEGDFSYPGTFNGEIVVTYNAGPLSFPGIVIRVLPSLPRTTG